MLVLASATSSFLPCGHGSVAASAGPAAAARPAVPARAAAVLAQAPAAVGSAAATDEEKIALAKTFLLEGNGFYSPLQPELFAENFVFRAPVVGPLCKKDYLATMGLFKLWEALPDLEANDFGWCVDPGAPSTVRVFTRNTGTHSGPLNVGSVVLPPTGKAYEGTVESLSVTLDESGKVKALTAGYVVDRFGGNGGGLGAIAGILVAIGLPVPKPYGPLFRFSQWLGNTFGSKFGPRTISAEEDLPSWYTNPLRGSEGF